MLNLSIYRALWEQLFLCMHTIIVPSVELLLKVKKLFIIEIYVSIQHSTLLEDEIGIRQDVHTKISNESLFSVNEFAK